MNSCLLHLPVYCHKVDNMKRSSHEQLFTLLACLLSQGRSDEGVISCNSCLLYLPAYCHKVGQMKGSSHEQLFIILACLLSQGRSDEGVIS
jgi:hypothetical protein